MGSDPHFLLPQAWSLVEGSHLSFSRESFCFLGKFSFKWLSHPQMGAHSSIRAWRIPWTEEPGRLMGSQRVGHN